MASTSQTCKCCQPTTQLPYYDNGSGDQLPSSISLKLDGWQREHTFVPHERYLWLRESEISIRSELTACLEEKVRLGQTLRQRTAALLVSVLLLLVSLALWFPLWTNVNRLMPTGLAP
jgi:hypothetical protein